MPAIEFDLIIEQGTTKRFAVVRNDADSGDPISFANLTPRAHIRAKYADDAPLVALAIDDGITFSVDNLTMTVEFTAEQTASLPATMKYAPNLAEPLPDDCKIKSYVWDLEFENSVTGDVDRYFQGRVYVSPEATK